MNKTLLSFLLITILSFGILNAQTKKLPTVKLKDLSGKTVDVSKMSNDGNPIIISFWATWCKPCKLELNTIAEEIGRAHV